MTPLNPEQAANIAKHVYDLRLFSVGQLIERGLPLGCEGLFTVQDDSRFSGKSGSYIFRQLSGFGYIAEGEGTRQGEILIATRGTSTGFDLVSDFHTGVRRGPSGLPVHIGFQRLWETYAEELRVFLRGKNPSHVHCVGRSLGAAEATLNADFCSANKLPVSIYTFGCPRVGPSSFSQDLLATLVIQSAVVGPQCRHDR
jgi:hypothetical protein